MSETIKVSIELADAAAQKSLSDFLTKSASLDKNFKKVGDAGKGSFNDITVGIGKSIGVYDIFAGNLAANVVTKGFELIASAAGQLFNVLIVDGIKAAQESENALNSLNVALGQSGIFSKSTSKEFQAFATQIQSTTAFEDDLVIKNIALLASLTNLDKEGLKKTTTAAVELSAALGKDLGTTTEALAKAANGNFTALNKMGIQFEKTGSQSQTYANALEAIEKFNGTAASKINTFSGALERSANFVNQLQEKFGELVISNPAVVAALGFVSNVLKDLASSFTNNTDSAQTFARAFITIIDIVGVTVKVFDVLVVGILTAWDTIITATTVALAALVKPFTFFSDTASTIFDNLTEQAGESVDSIKERFDNGTIFTKVANTIDDMSAAAEVGFAKIGTGAATAGAEVVNFKGKTKELTEEQQKSLEEVNKYVEGLAKRNQSTKENQDLELENLKLKNEQMALIEEESDLSFYENKLARERAFYVASQAILDANFAAEQVKIASSTQSAVDKTNALLAIDKKFQNDSLKAQVDFDKKKITIEKAQDDSTVANRKSTFSTIATLSNSNNKTLAAIGKAAAIAQIAIEGPIAITKALASAPPPFNFVLAGLVGTAIAAQAAQIAGLNFAEGGIVPGTSFSGDNVAANVNSGEMILNRKQQAELFKVANGSREGAGSETTNRLLGQLISAVKSSTSIQIDGREIFNVTRDQLASGRSY